MCRGRRARILLHLHIQLKGTVLFVCLLLQDLVQSCLRGGGGDMGGHVLRETTSRGLCVSERTNKRHHHHGLGCPSRPALVCVCLLLQDAAHHALSITHSGGSFHKNTGLPKK
jgi:hypothetical protein